MTIIVIMMKEIMSFYNKKVFHLSNASMRCFEIFIKTDGDLEFITGDYNKSMNRRPCIVVFF